MYKVRFWMASGESGNLRLRNKEQVLAHIVLYFKRPVLQTILHTFNRNGSIHYNNMGIEFEAYQVKEEE